MGCERIWVKREAQQTFDFPKGSTPIIDFRYLSISSPSPPSSPFHCAEITSSRSSPAPWLLCLVPTSMATWNTSDLDLLTSNLGWVQEDLCFFVLIFLPEFAQMFEIHAFFNATF